MMFRTLFAESPHEPTPSAPLKPSGSAVHSSQPWPWARGLVGTVFLDGLLESPPGANSDWSPGLRPRLGHLWEVLNPREGQAS